MEALGHCAVVDGYFGGKREVEDLGTWTYFQQVNFECFCLNIHDPYFPLLSKTTTKYGFKFSFKKKKKKNPWVGLLLDAILHTILLLVQLRLQ